MLLWCGNLQAQLDCSVILTSGSTNQNVCLGEAITPIVIESKDNKINLVPNLPAGLKQEHVKTTINGDNDAVHCSDYFKIVPGSNGNHLKVENTGISLNASYPVVFYKDENYTNKHVNGFVDCQRNQVNDAGNKKQLDNDEFTPGVTYYMVVNLGNGKTCRSTYNTEYGSANSSYADIQKGDAVKISGTPSAAGTYSFTYNTQNPCSSGGSITITINVGSVKISCKNYSVLSKDGNVNFPIADMVGGQAESWTLDNKNLSVSRSGYVVGSLPFGTTAVLVKGYKCNNTDSCTSSITVIKETDPCAK